MKEHERWHHKDHDPIGGEHKRKTKQCEAGALIIGFLLWAKRREVMSAVVGMSGLILVPALTNACRAVTGTDAPSTNEMAPTTMRGTAGSGARTR